MSQAEGGVTIDELRLAARNHAMPLEAMAYDVTPIGLHYLLTHFDMPVIDAEAWRLEVGGSVRRPLRLTMDDLRAMPAVTRRVTMECAGNGRMFIEPRPLSQPWLLEAVGTGEWTGVELADVLARAELASGAVEVVFASCDRGVEHGVEQVYERSLNASAAMESDALLAYELNGTRLPPQHGYPLRLIVPGWYGMTNVKWLTSITAVDAPFSGFQQTEAYCLRYREEDPGEPLTRMRPRALVIPPGIPEYTTRTRLLAPGEHRLTGRAWSGFAPITDVEVSVDGGSTWVRAEVEPGTDEVGVWQRWNHLWHARPGDHVLMCRASDVAGNVQPLDPSWNVGGYANNAVQRVPVNVS